MSLNKVLFSCNHVVKEYLLLMRDETVRRLLDESSLRSIGNKTSCVIELTRRVLNRRVGGWRVVKYVIVRVVGEDEAAVRLCNRLLEAHMPSYRLRREYVRRAECCTIYPGEMAPDNTALYFSFQRSGAARCHYGDVLVKSPYEPSLLRPSDRCCWKTGDSDLRKGVVITERRQVETYLSFRLARSTNTDGVSKSKNEDAHFDPKAPIRYMFDDYDQAPGSASHHKNRKVIKKVAKYNDYPENKNEYLKSVNFSKTILTSPKHYNIESPSIEEEEKVLTEEDKPEINENIKSLLAKEDPLTENIKIEDSVNTVPKYTDETLKRISITDNKTDIYILNNSETEISLQIEKEFIDTFLISDLIKLIGNDAKLNNISFTIPNDIDEDNITEIIEHCYDEITKDTIILKEDIPEVKLPMVHENISEHLNEKMNDESISNSKNVSFSGYVNSLYAVDNEDMKINVVIHKIYSEISWVITIVCESILDNLVDSIEYPKLSDYLNVDNRIQKLESDISDIQQTFLQQNEISVTNVSQNEESLFIIKSIEGIIDSIIIDQYEEIRIEYINERLKEFSSTISTDNTKVSSETEESVNIDIFEEVQTIYLIHETNVTDLLVEEVMDEILIVIKTESLNFKRHSLNNTRLNQVEKNLDINNRECFMILSIDMDVIEHIITEVLERILQTIQTSKETKSTERIVRYNEIIQNKNDFQNVDVSVNEDEYDEKIEPQILNSLNTLDEVIVSESFISSEKENDYRILNVVNDCTKYILTKYNSEIIDYLSIRIANEIQKWSVKETIAEDVILECNIANNIIDKIIIELYNETCYQYEKLQMEYQCLIKPMKNPSARLIEASKIIGTVPLNNNILPNKPLALKLNISATIEPPSKILKKEKTKHQFLKDSDANIINIESENQSLTKFIHNESDRGHRKLEIKSHLVPIDLFHSREFERHAHKFTTPKQHSALIYESQNSLNITSSTIWDGHKTVVKKSNIGIKDMQKNYISNIQENCQVINIDIDNDISTPNTPLHQYNEGYFRFQHIMNVNHLSDLNLINYVNENEISQQTEENALKKKYSDVVEIEDSLDIILDSKVITAPLKIEHQINLMTSESTLYEDSLYDAIQVTYLVNFEFASQNPEELEQVILSAEFILPKAWYYPTVEGWQIDKIENPRNSSNLSPINIPSSIEISGELNYLNNPQNESDVMLKYTDVLLSQFSNPEFSNINSKMPVQSLTEFYTTVSIDNDQETNNLTYNFEIQNNPNINTQLSSIDDVISSMTNEIEEVEDDEKYENFVVEREKIILIMKSDCGSPTNIIKLQQLRKSPIDSNIDKITIQCSTGETSCKQTNKSPSDESSENDSSFTNAIKSILYNTNNERRYKTSSSKTASFPQDNGTSVDNIESQRNTSRSIKRSQPLIKKTLLDLSKEVKSKQIEKYMSTLNEDKHEENVYPNVKSIFRSFSNNNDSSFEFNQGSSMNSNGFNFSSVDLSNIKLKPRRRSLSEKIKMVAKQVIAKLNPLKRNKDSEAIETSESCNHFNRSYILSDLSCKSSIDSQLSKNSLARYWNIHKFDSIKRMKVKGRLPQTILG